MKHKEQTHPVHAQRAGFWTPAGPGVVRGLPRDPLMCLRFFRHYVPHPNDLLPICDTKAPNGAELGVDEVDRYVS